MNQRIAIAPNLAHLDQGKWSDPEWRLRTLYTIVTDDGAEMAFAPNPEQLALIDALWHRNLILKARQLGMCVDPATLVLTADLSWVPIADIKPGDEVVAVDEGA